MCGFFVSSFFEYFMTMVTLGEGLVFAAFWQLSIGIWRASYDRQEVKKASIMCVEKASKAKKIFF